MPKPRAPAAELLKACAPLQGDDGSAGSALRADSANRDAHIACQTRHGGLAAYVRNLMARGWLEAVPEAQP